jgi:hypothetical protein
MSTITPVQPMAIPMSPAPSEASVPLLGGDQRIVFRGVDWHTYNQLSESVCEGQHVHLVYDGKDLEIMVIGNAHEILKGRISKIVNAVAMGRGVNCLDSGQATWKTNIRGLEADLSYYFDPEKIRVAKEAFACDSMDPADYPRPDMAIEIDMSPSQVDRPAVYRDLRVAEIWRFARRAKLIIEQLQPDGSYTAVEESRFLRIRPDDVLHWLKEAETEDELVWHRRLTQWVMGLGRRAAPGRRRAGKPPAKRKAKDNGK